VRAAGESVSESTDRSVDLWADGQKIATVNIPADWLRVPEVICWHGRMFVQPSSYFLTPFESWGRLTYGEALTLRVDS